MQKFSKLLTPFTAIFVIIFLIAIITSPKICTEGVARGIMLCGNVIIPSLFPFTVCVMIILNSGILSRLRFLEIFTEKLFCLTSEQFAVMLLSFIGGYPLGANMINELVKSNKISKNNAKIMINYCVNAGPAFTVLAVGASVLSSKKLGYILLFSHILAAFILALAFRFMFDRKNIACSKTEPPRSITFSDNIVLSTAKSASAIINICSYVILFSAITNYIDAFSKKIYLLKYIKFILEVTVGITQTHNILLISFLLGFAGISVWCQVISVSTEIKPNIGWLALTRIFHGLISVIITAIILKLFKINITTAAHQMQNLRYYYSGFSLSVSMLITVIVFLISITSKKSCGKILKDLV